MKPVANIRDIENHEQWNPSDIGEWYTQGDTWTAWDEMGSMVDLWDTRTARFNLFQLSLLVVDWSTWGWIKAWGKRHQKRGEL